MEHPSKRQRLSGDHEMKMERRVRYDRGAMALHRRQVEIVVTEVAVSVTENVSVDVDSNGVPTATTTFIVSPSAATAVPSSAAATTASPAAPSSPAAAATPSVASPSSAPSAASGSGSGSSSASTPKPAAVTSSPSSSLLSDSSSRASSITSRSGVLSASSLGGFNSSSTLSTSILTSLSSDLLSSSIISNLPSSSLASTAESSSSSLPFVPPGVGVGSGVTDPSSVPSAHGRNGTAKAPGNDGTSPPVVAGAVVGSVGGMAVLLLLLVLVARWYRHHSRSLRYASQSESATDLTPHGSLYPPPQRRSFLPAGAAAFINRLSGSHHRGQEPTLPDVQERGFQKVAGRKLPSQFPTGMEEGPVSKDFEKQPPESAAQRRMRGVTQQSPSSSYYRDSNDTTKFFSMHAAGDTAPRPLFAASSSDDPSPEPGPSNAMNKEIIRPSPARTPNITSSEGPYFRDFATPPPDERQQRPPYQISRRPVMERPITEFPRGVDH